MGFVQLGKRFYSTKGLFRVIWGSVGFAQFVQCFQACIGLVGFSKACYSVMMSMVSSLTAIPSRCSSPKARHTLWTLNPKPLNPTFSSQNLIKVGVSCKSLGLRHHVLKTGFFLVKPGFPRKP